MLFDFARRFGLICPYFGGGQKGVGEITLSPHSVKQICVVKQPVGDVKKQLGQDVASISKWYLEEYQRINDVIVKNQILVVSFIGYLGDNISISENL